MLNSAVILEDRCLYCAFERRYVNWPVTYSLANRENKGIENSKTETNSEIHAERKTDRNTNKCTDNPTDNRLKKRTNEADRQACRQAINQAGKQAETTHSRWQESSKMRANRLIHVAILN